MALPLAHHHLSQGKSLPPIRHMLVHVLVVFLAIVLPLKEDSQVSSNNNTRRAVILDSRLVRDILGSLLCQYLHLKLHHNY